MPCGGESAGQRGAEFLSTEATRPRRAPRTVIIHAISDDTRDSPGAYC